MTERRGQDEMTNAEALRLGQHRSREGPPFERREVGQLGTVEMVEEPDRVEAELLARVRAFADLRVVEAELRHVDPELDRHAGQATGGRVTEVAIVPTA